MEKKQTTMLVTMPEKTTKTRKGGKNPAESGLLTALDGHIYRTKREKRAVQHSANWNGGTPRSTIARKQKKKETPDPPPRLKPNNGERLPVYEKINSTSMTTYGS